MAWGQCNRLDASFLPDFCCLWEDPGRFVLLLLSRDREKEAGGKCTYTQVREKRNKCVFVFCCFFFCFVFDRSMTGGERPDWEVSL